MFGATNRTITKIYETSIDDYGTQIIIGETIININCWFESSYKEFRNSSGDIFTTEVIAILPYNSIFEEGKIIQINSKNYKIETIRYLEDFSINKRIELSLKEEV